MEAVTQDEFAAMLAPMLAQPVRQVDILKYAARLYSCMWLLRAHTPEGPVGVVAKAWYSAMDFDKQLKALQAASAAYAGRADVCIPYIGSQRSKCILLMRQVPDPTLAEMCRFSFRRRWTQTLLQACARTGCWLAEWHAASEKVEPVAPSLEAYLQDRGDCLRLLTADEQRRLTALIRSLGDDTTCVTHGDFMPGNVLWAPTRISVIDFGLPEWDRASPWWDYVAMEVGLTCALRFSSKSPGRWKPSMVQSAVEAFREGYGKRRGNGRTRLACTAVRHLVLHAGDMRHGKAYRKRAEWHKLQLKKALLSAEK
ncbi:MAG TPA: phosphotransferase [Gammaproteobacteria bacterium]|nr:phosphotransferase [Gammaproteobacteria bacterium]